MEIYALKVKKQAILVQCHNKPEQINKLIDFLPSQYFDFYIHVDKKSLIEDKIIKHDNIVLVENRIDVRWGQVSQIEATIELLNKIPDSSHYTYIHLISGNDFVIKSPEYIINLFSSENRTEYIDSTELGESFHWSWGGFDRVQCYYPQFIIQRPTFKIARIIRVCYREFVMRTKIFKRKKKPVDCFYGGSQWWSLTGEMVFWIKEYLKNNPDYLLFFRHGVCVDEVFFATLVRYSPFKNNISNDSLRYIRWDDLANRTGGPSVLTIQDVEDMVASNYVFARKICDMDTIEAVLREIE